MKQLKFIAKGDLFVVIDPEWLKATGHENHVGHLFEVTYIEAFLSINWRVQVPVVFYRIETPWRSDWIVDQRRCIAEVSHRSTT